MTSQKGLSSLIGWHLPLERPGTTRVIELGICVRARVNNNYVRFGQKYFKQTVDVAMGSRIAPPLAIVFMDAVESLLLTSKDSQYQPVTYMRYIDDVLGIWTH